MTVSRLSLLNRLWLSFASGFKVLFDHDYASRVASLGSGYTEAPSLSPAASPQPPEAKAAAAPEAPAHEEALQLLALLQREGRFVDFIQQEITAFSDADIGAAARLVHEGCRRALHQHGRVVSVRSEQEGAPLTLERASSDVKLVGNVSGAAPFRGVLRHRGWRVEGLSLPKLLGNHDPRLIAPAELELS